MFSFFGNTFSFTEWRMSFCNHENPWHWLFLREYVSCPVFGIFLNKDMLWRYMYASLS